MKDLNHPKTLGMAEEKERKWAFVCFSIELSSVHPSAHVSLFGLMVVSPSPPTPSELKESLE